KSLLEESKNSWETYNRGNIDNIDDIIKVEMEYGKIDKVHPKRPQDIGMLMMSEIAKTKIMHDKLDAAAFSIEFMLETAYIFSKDKKDFEGIVDLLAFELKEAEDDFLEYYNDNMKDEIDKYLEKS